MSAKWPRAISSLYQVRSAAQSCPTLCDPMDHSMPGFPVHHSHFAWMLPTQLDSHVWLWVQMSCWVCITDKVILVHKLSMQFVDVGLRRVTANGCLNFTCKWFQPYGSHSSLNTTEILLFTVKYNHINFGAAYCQEGTKNETGHVLGVPFLYFLD